MDRFAHLDWPFFEPGHAELARRAESWAAANLGYAHDENEDSVCRRLVKDLGAAGFLAHCAPEDSRFDVRSLAVLREVFAFHAGLADFALTMQGLGSGPVALAGTEQQKRRYVGRAARGEAIAAFALSEPDAGSDVAALATRAWLRAARSRRGAAAGAREKNVRPGARRLPADADEARRHGDRHRCRRAARVPRCLDARREAEARDPRSRHGEDAGDRDRPGSRRRRGADLRRAGRHARSSGREALSRSARAAHLRRRDRGAEVDHRSRAAEGIAWGPRT